MRMANCHPDQKHYAKGVCKRCYDVASVRRNLPASVEPPAAVRRQAMCHPERTHYAKGQCRPCYDARRQGFFPLAPLLAFAGGEDGPIDNAELVYRTNGIVQLDPERLHLTEVEADHLAVALGRLPGDIWREQWEDFDGPHYDDPQPDAFGPTYCQCKRCERIPGVGEEAARHR